MRRMNHLRAGVLALRLLGVILVIFNGLDIIRLDKSSIAYVSALIIGGFWLLVGIGLIVVAGIIKKKLIK